MFDSFICSGVILRACLAFMPGQVMGKACFEVAGQGLHDRLIIPTIMDLARPTISSKTYSLVSTMNYVARQLQKLGPGSDHIPNVTEFETTTGFFQLPMEAFLNINTLTTE